MTSTRAERQAWWASLDNDQKAAHVERWTAQRAAKREASPNWAWCRACAAHDIATARGIFMREVTREEVRDRIMAAYPQCLKYLARLRIPAPRSAT